MRKAKRDVACSSFSFFLRRMRCANLTRSFACTHTHTHTQVPGRKEVFDLTAVSEKEKNMWIETLKYVTSVASNRGMIIRQKMGRTAGDNYVGQSEFYVDEDDIPESPRRGREVGQANLRMRFEVDVTSIPPGSAERSRFISAFQDDISVCLFRSSAKSSSTVKVLGVKPAAGMDWLTVVEFDIVVGPRDASKEALVSKLSNMVANPNSDLYMGMVTCQADSTYDGILQAGEDGAFNAEGSAAMRAIATPVPRVKAVLEKYMHLEVPKGVHDPSTFHIYLRFDSNIKTLWVPSPRTLPRRSCVLWPYEVKDCLGITGTVYGKKRRSQKTRGGLRAEAAFAALFFALFCFVLLFLWDDDDTFSRSTHSIINAMHNPLLDIWMTPIALNPSGVPSSLASPLNFSQSARHGDMPIVDTSLLRQGVTYDVVFEDRRLECLEDLSESQKIEIQENFAKYDVDGDGTISREECIQVCSERTERNIELIEKQFEKALETAGTDQERQKVLELKEVHVQKVKEAEAQLLTQLTSADLNGDGILSEQEFYLAEAWWIKSTLNPKRVALF